MAEDRPIFVLASGLRCGSTLLQRLLNSHPEVLVGGEQGGLLNRFFPEVERLLESASAYRGQRDAFCQSGYVTFSANLLPPAEAIRGVAATFVRSLFAEPAVTSTLLDFFPDGRVVHLTRDVVDCFLSLLECEETSATWTRASTEGVFLDWARINASVLDANARSRQTITVRYKDLVADPDAAISALADHLSLDPGAFDRRVFARRIHWHGEFGEAERRLRTGRVLTSVDWELPRRPPLPDLSASLGYRTDDRA